MDNLKLKVMLKSEKKFTYQSWLKTHFIDLIW